MAIYAVYSRYINSVTGWVDVYFETDANQVLVVAQGQPGYPSSRQFVTGEILDELLDRAQSGTKYLRLDGGALDLKAGAHITASGPVLFEDGFSVYFDGYTKFRNLNLDGPLNALGDKTIRHSDVDIAAIKNIGLVFASGKKIQVDYTPSDPKDVVNKAYLDLVAGYGLNPAKGGAVRAATTTNITLSGLQTIDDVVLVEGDRVLVKNQTNKTQNGIYIVTTGVWTRADDADDPAELTGLLVAVTEGTVNKRCIFWESAEVSVVGTSNIEFALFINAADYYTAGGGLTLVGNHFSIANSGVTTVKIADNAVTTEKIVNNAVTGSKISQGTITGYNIATKTITNDLIADATIQMAKLANMGFNGASLIDPPSADVTNQPLDTIFRYFATMIKNISGESAWNIKPAKKLTDKQNKIHYGSTAPSDPQPGDIWIKTSS